jgi:DNA-binding MarR family transcriptional regulator
MKDLSSYLRIAPPSATSVIEAMLAKDLVKRETSSKDRRTIRVVLTPKAWKFFHSLQETKHKIFHNMTKQLSTSEKQQFINILTILTEK